MALRLPLYQSTKCCYFSRNTKRHEFALMTSSVRRFVGMLILLLVTVCLDWIHLFLRRCSKLLVLARSRNPGNHELQP